MGEGAKSNWEILSVIRDVDKVAAKLPTQAVCLLLMLVLHGGKGRIFPSVHRLGRLTGMTERNVRRWLAHLVERDLIVITRGRHHTPNTYTLREVTLTALPKESGQPCPPLEGSRPDATVLPDAPRADNAGSSGRTMRVAREDNARRQGGHQCPPKISLKISEEKREDLRFPPRPLQDSKAEPTSTTPAERGFQQGIERETETRRRDPRDPPPPPSRKPLVPPPRHVPSPGYRDAAVADQQQGARAREACRRPTMPSETTPQDIERRRQEQVAAAAELVKTDPRFAPVGKGAVS